MSSLVSQVLLRIVAKTASQHPTSMPLDQGETLGLVPHRVARGNCGWAFAAALMLTAGLALCSAEAAVAPANDLAKTLERYDRGIILINCKNQKGEEVQLGSGFIIDEKGLAATCFHVLRGASSAEATLADGSKVAVKGVRAWDEMGDIAIIELARTPKKLTALPLRKDPKRQVGESVTAIGHPQRCPRHALKTATRAARAALITPVRRPALRGSPEVVCSRKTLPSGV